MHLRGIIKLHWSLLLLKRFPFFLLEWHNTKLIITLRDVEGVQPGAYLPLWTLWLLWFKFLPVICNCLNLFLVQWGYQLQRCPSRGRGLNGTLSETKPVSWWAAYDRRPHQTLLPPSLGLFSSACGVYLAAVNQPAYISIPIPGGILCLVA